jgi:flagellar biosynthetic protein FliQ
MFTTQTVLTIGAEALWLTMLISAPLLLAALAAGLLIGIIQAATQINEMTLSFIPKLLAMFAVMVAAGPWMMATMIDFMRRMITQIPTIIG